MHECYVNAQSSKYRGNRMSNSNSNFSSNARHGNNNFMHGKFIFVREYIIFIAKKISVRKFFQHRNNDCQHNY